jgi:hypothetical protein
LRRGRLDNYGADAAADQPLRHLSQRQLRSPGPKLAHRLARPTVGTATSWFSLPTQALDVRDHPASRDDKIDHKEKLNNKINHKMIQ